MAWLAIVACRSRRRTSASSSRAMRLRSTSTTVMGWTRRSRAAARVAEGSRAAPPGCRSDSSTCTCWRRLRDWQRAGVWQRLHQVVLDQLGCDGGIDWSRASVDSISVRAKRGLPDRPEPDRPRQARLQIPRARRAPRHPVGGRVVGGQHPRLDVAGANGGRGAGDQGPTGSAGSDPPAAPR
jgi:transposase